MEYGLASIGMSFDTWQQAMQAAIASGRLEVTGEIRGGQLVQFSDPSGAQLNMLAVEPYATYAGFASTAAANAHVTMVNDVLALAEIVTDNGTPISTITCNLAQGPLLVEEPTLEWEQLALTAMGMDVAVFDNSEAFRAAGGQAVGLVVSQGAAVVATGDGSRVPDASAQIAVEVVGAEYRYTALTNQRFIHLDVISPVPMDVCIPDTPALPAPGSIVAGTAMLVGSIKPPAGCGDGDGCGSGGCGCGSGGCGSH
ncbi:hypothetical protein C1Y63_10945 [Corynebacterium sp. 13CS0277]|uniref:hypothetical protein n=1 Tax=Corynebacterium sp. 13CS0277 TaxID=2071994 RepID=UPI000D02BB74|nr:hypothetical protein [Corynebacterium sp. 13CS0277]PRQ10557.1 hypothetical protein C1Y63_10945 [Corynebacterium sp. 13CS0277]